MSITGEMKKDKMNLWILTIFYTLEYGDKQVLWTWSRLLFATEALDVKRFLPFKDQHMQN